MKRYQMSMSNTYINNGYNFSELNETIRSLTPKRINIPLTFKGTWSTTYKNPCIVSSPIFPQSLTYETFKKICESVYCYYELLYQGKPISNGIKVFTNGDTGIDFARGFDYGYKNGSNFRMSLSRKVGDYYIVRLTSASHDNVEDKIIGHDSSKPIVTSFTLRITFLENIPELFTI